MDNSGFLCMHRMRLALSQVEALPWQRPGSGIPSISTEYAQARRRCAQVIHMFVHRQQESSPAWLAGSSGSARRCLRARPVGRMRGSGPGRDEIAQEGSHFARPRRTVARCRGASAMSVDLTIARRCRERSAALIAACQPSMRTACSCACRQSSAARKACSWVIARSVPSRQSRISWPKKGYPTRPDTGMCCSPLLSTRYT